MFVYCSLLILFVSCIIKENKDRLFRHIHLSAGGAAGCHDGSFVQDDGQSRFAVDSVWAFVPTELPQLPQRSDAGSAH